VIPLPIKLLHHDAQIPKYQTAGASGMDLHCVHPVSAWGNVYAPDLSEPETLVPFWRMTACVEQITKIVLSPGDRVLFSTGISLSIPPGYEGQIRPRSGWALKDGITVLNSPGTIDSDYKGEIKVLLINLGHESVEIKRGDRIAQLVIAPVIKAELVIVEELETSARGDSGFGSSGK
jgi:dUTP pyrophosphatase